MLGLIMLVGFNVGMNVRNQNGHPLHAQSQLQQPQPARPLTLVEAWNVIDTYGKIKQPKAIIVRLQSVDHAADSPTSGEDGRRRVWLATFLRVDSSKLGLVVRLVDGVVAEDSEAPALDGAVGLGRPTLDSPKALALAQATKSGFSSVNEKGQGFHFVLESTQSGSSVVTVMGSFHNKPAMIKFDVATSKVVSTRIFTFALGGVLYSSDAGRTWQASNLENRMVTAVQPDPLKVNVAYATVAEGDKIAVYQTRDQGQTWSPLAALPEAAGDWPFSLSAVAGPSGSVWLVVGTLGWTPLSRHERGSS